MTAGALTLSILAMLGSVGSYAFERVECMDRPDGSVYIFKRIPDQKDSLDVRIYHGRQFTRYSLPGIPIGIEEDYLNTRYDTRTPEARRRAIADFSPLERLIFNMDIVFHHEFRGCEISAGTVNCLEEGPIKVGKVWISEVKFFFDTRSGDDVDAEAVYTIGIKGESTASGLEFASGRHYFRYGDYSQCRYLHQDGW